MKYRTLAILLILFFASSRASGGHPDFAHWQRPVSLGSVKNIEAGPYPEECGRCHADRYSEWNGSLHSKSVGPGLSGQLDVKADPATAILCNYCHAPAMEQTEVTEAREGPAAGTFSDNPAFDKKLKSSGVSCAVCHVRGGKVIGPVKKRAAVSGEGVHVSVQDDFFRQAEFCAACHQLDQGYELNGKLMINTYEEWKSSAYGKNRIVCQDCHMPGQRHLFRGIHDPEMTRSGVSIEVRKNVVRDGIRARLTLTNSGAGHYFPTYATPMVVVKGFQEVKGGSVAPGSLREATVGRMVSLDLSEEFYDTRIPPFEKFVFNYDAKINTGSERLVFEVWVYPDEFYARFYKSLLKGDSKIDRAEITSALKMAESSRYLLFRKELKI